MIKPPVKGATFKMKLFLIMFKIATTPKFYDSKSLSPNPISFSIENTYDWLKNDSLGPLSHLFASTL